MYIETVLIKTAPSEGNASGEVLINKCDFDPAVHTLAGAVESPELTIEEAAKAAAEAATKQPDAAQGELLTVEESKADKKKGR